MQRFTPLLIDAARPCRHTVGSRLFVDETDVKGHCCVDGSPPVSEGAVVKRRRRPVPLDLSAFAGFRFPPEVILLAVRWYLRFGLSYRDLEELLVERGIEVDHVTPCFVGRSASRG